MLVDSHCHLDHLDLTEFGGKLEGAIANAHEHGVGHMLCVCVDLPAFPTILSLAKCFDNVFASVGVHPNEQPDQEPRTEELIALSQDAKVIAIGETGLDYFRSQGNLEWQRERFRRHIKAARLTGKPLIIHSRAAREDILRTLREEGADQIGGVMHCFTEDWDTAKQAMDLNFYISFSGIVTFNSARELNEVAARVPLERLLLETDSPYLAPVPYRGKSNQPAYVRHVAQHIANVRSLPLEVIAEHSTRNFFALFQAAEPVYS